MPRAKKPTLRQRMEASLLRRQEALRNGCAGMVPLCCEECGRPLRTTAVDQAHGEPPIAMEFPDVIAEDKAHGWTVGCSDCAQRRRAGAA